MSNLSNSYCAHQKLRTDQETSNDSKQYYYQGLPIQIVDNFVRSNKRIALIETMSGDRFEVFIEMLE